MLLNKLNLPAASRVASLRRRVIGVAALLVILAGSDFESRADCFGGPSRSFVQVVSSGDHSCGLTAEGAAYCWGYDGSGQLGDGGGSTSSQSPVAVDTSSIVGEKAFVMLAAGGSHTCGLTAEGTAYCWGHDGLLGNGGGAPHDCGGIPCAQSPVLVDTSAIAGEKSFVMLSAGNYHTCGLTSEGAAYCWGYDVNGQLGDGGTSTDSQSPVAVDTSAIAGEKSFVILAAGWGHTCGLTAEGAAYCWGSDSDGQLGDGGTSINSQSPVLVDTSSIAAEKLFVTLSAGSYHTCGLTAEGAAYCWGWDIDGQLGDGGASTSSQSPVLVDTSAIAGEKAFVILAAGGFHTCGLTVKGVPYCWGGDHYGEIGNGDGAPHDCGGFPCSQSPVFVDTSAIAGEKSFVTLSAGDFHTCGLTAEGAAYCWGWDSDGRLGDGGTSTDSHSPVAVDTSAIDGEKAFVILAAGYLHTCGLTAEGVAYCWGWDNFGQLGDGGTSINSQSPVAVDTFSIAGEKAFVMLSAGSYHTCGLTTEGAAYCWGWDSDGQLGDGGTSINSQGPVAVDTSSIAGEKLFVMLAAGRDHTCGLTAKGAAYCWGRDFHGQLGDGGTSTNSQSPVLVDTSAIVGEKSFVMLAAGGFHTCGLNAEGAAYCWGYDDYGQLGDGGTSTSSQSPVLVDTSAIAGAKSFVTLAAGSSHTCGLTSEGAAYCWGYDDYGQLGDGGTSTDFQSPVLVDTSTIAREKSFVILVAGGQHTCGLNAEGAAYCWGWDCVGQLGDGNATLDDCFGDNCSQSPVAVEYCIPPCLVDTDCRLCEQCVSGSCATQAAGSDVKEECPAGECLTGNCDGNGYCGYEPAGALCGDQGMVCHNDDYCDEWGSCVDSGFEADGTPCPDGDRCNGEETCDEQGICVAGTPLVCDDDEVCTDDRCDPLEGCRHSNNDDPCNDGDDCTGNDVCKNGSCVGGPLDADGDNFTEASCGGTDCNDDDEYINPDATEICSDGIDNNCDGDTDLDDEECKRPASGCNCGTKGSTVQVLMGSLGLLLLRRRRR